LEVARILIEAYKCHVGGKKKILKELAGELEINGYDYRFVRGLSFLLDRRSIFKCKDTVDPIDLRRQIYEITERTGLPTTLEQRDQILELVASKLKVTPEIVEELFYADLDSELTLEEFNELPPQDLLEDYNLSLTQTLLFDSTELNFATSGNWQRIFYAIKKLGLIYSAYEDNGIQVKIDGPVNLFKLTRRYGTAMAKLLPAIIVNSTWNIEAKILWKYTNEIYDFKIESSKHHLFFRKLHMPTILYDSSVEKEFAMNFQALKSQWQLRREPEPIIAGKHVIIPDFSLERDSIKVYMEIVGFWTTEYLLRKIEKLKKVDVNMLVAVNENLACEKTTDLERHSRLNIIYYRSKVPLASIVRYLEEAFQKVEVKQRKFLKDLHAVFTESFIKYEDFAARVGVSTKAAKAVLIDEPPEDYIPMSDGLIKRMKLEKIGKRMEEHISKSGRLHLSEAERIFEEEGVEDSTSAVEILGYKIVWHEISSEKAEIVKLEDEEER